MLLVFLCAVQGQIIEIFQGQFVLLETHGYKILFSQVKHWEDWVSFAFQVALKLSKHVRVKGSIVCVNLLRLFLPLKARTMTQPLKFTQYSISKLLYLIFLEMCRHSKGFCLGEHTDLFLSRREWDKHLRLCYEWRFEHTEAAGLINGWQSVTWFTLSRRIFCDWMTAGSSLL